MKAVLTDWVKDWLSDLEVLRAVGVALRLDVDPGASRTTVLRTYLGQAQSSPKFFLNLLDAVVAVRSEAPHWVGDQALEAHLLRGASAWRVNDARVGLERRVSEELTATVRAATSPNDEASNHLREAWSNAYGRNGNPSDAWDHGIKAVECLLCPVVVPKKDKPTLGDVLGVLRRNDGDKWRGSLPGKDKDHPVAPVVGALDLLWPNPDRHGEVKPRPPTEEEARSVVAVVAALVQAHRETPLVYKMP